MVAGLAIGLPAFELRSAPWAVTGIVLLLIGLLLYPSQQRAHRGAVDDDPGDLGYLGDLGDLDTPGDPGDLSSTHFDN